MTPLLFNTEEIFKQNFVVFYDGECAFCNNSVKWILEKDQNKVFKFASLQSDFGFIVKSKLSLPIHYTDSIIVWDPITEDGYLGFEALYYIAQNLPEYKTIAKVIKYTPAFLGNSIYKFIARNRYYFTTKKVSCDLRIQNLYYNQFL